MRIRPAAGAYWYLLFMAVFALGACWWYYSKCTQKLQIANANLHKCETLSAQIQQARQAPQRAQLSTRSQEDLGGSIEKAAAAANIQRDRILRIDPQPGKRLGKTDYLEQGTEVELVTVTLRQLVEFLHNVASTDERLQVGTLRMRSPHGPEAASSGELWLADVVLTQRVYAPTTPRRE